MENQEIKVEVTLKEDGKFKIDTNANPLFAIKLLSEAIQNITDDLANQISKSELELEDESETVN